VYLAEIETAHKEHVLFKTVEKLPPAAPSVCLRLYAALIKFDHFEWMIEKATELGVTEIVTFEAARTERGLDRAAHKRIARWRRVALEASQQSRRARLPEVREPVAFAEAIADSSAYRFVLDEEPGGVALARGLPIERKASDSVALLIGPEGGWTPQEREAFVAAGWTRATLGPLILRAETAALAGLAVVAQAWKDK
jgi:16S rRNA (uracil1498-N3)-methyltransferase